MEILYDVRVLDLSENLKLGDKLLPLLDLHSGVGNFLPNENLYPKKEHKH